MKLDAFLTASGQDAAHLAALLTRDVSDVEAWLREDCRPDWATIDDIARVTGGLVTANDFMNRPPPNPGFSELRGSFDSHPTSLLFSARAHTLLEVIRRRKADDWRRAHGAAVTAWNVWRDEPDTSVDGARGSSRFDVHRMTDATGALVVNVQSDHLDGVQSRAVVPLLPVFQAPEPIVGMHPVVGVLGTYFVFASHLLTVVPLAHLGHPVASLAEERELMLKAIKQVHIELWP